MYHIGLLIRSLSSVAPLEGNLFQVICEAVIPSPEGPVTIVYDLPIDSTAFPSLMTNFDGVDTYSATIFFISPNTALDSGMYTCRAEVNGVTQMSGSFAVNFAGKTSCQWAN